MLSPGSVTNKVDGQLISFLEKTPPPPPADSSILVVFSFGVILWELFHLGTRIPDSGERVARAQSRPLRVKFVSSEGSIDRYFHPSVHRHNCSTCGPLVKSGAQSAASMEAVKSWWHGIMRDCWATEPEKRPAFRDLFRKADRRCPATDLIKRTRR
jgi:Protein tyrosine and serine/threonine kinase